MKKIFGFCSLALFSMTAYSADVLPPPAPGCVPHFENGQPQGCSVVEPGMKGGKNSGAVYEKLELRNGDVRTGSQDMQGAPGSIDQALKKARRLKVNRGGRTRTLPEKPQAPAAGE